ncbi:MAG: hypothetical protein LBG67_02735 [Campylobacteraceae bacterium]|jgi:hypothetical protein|nr:hypothetical protein [Campylobacteraceae bacterium]
MKINKMLIGFVMAVFTVVLFAGCVTKSGSLGIESISLNEIESNLKKGKTTQQDLVRLYGNPISKSLDEKGNELWVYTYTENKTGIVDYLPYVTDNTGNSYSKTLSATFNRKTKILTDYTVSEHGAAQTKQQVSDGSSFGAGVK